MTVDGLREALRPIVADWFDTGYETGTLDSDLLADRIVAALSSPEGGGAPVADHEYDPDCAACRHGDHLWVEGMWAIPDRADLSGLVLPVGDAPWKRMAERIDAMPEGHDRTQARIDLNAMLIERNRALATPDRADPDRRAEGLDDTAYETLVFVAHDVPDKPADPLALLMLCREKARAALSSPESGETSERAALDAGTHEPAVDDFGNQYLARVSSSDGLREAAETLFTLIDAANVPRTETITLARTGTLLEAIARLRAALSIHRADRPWPTRDDFRRMSAAEVNDFLASRGLDVRVVDHTRDVSDVSARPPAPDAARGEGRFPTPLATPDRADQHEHIDGTCDDCFRRGTEYATPEDRLRSDGPEPDRADPEREAYWQAIFESQKATIERLSAATPARADPEPGGEALRLLDILEAMAEAGDKGDSWPDYIDTARYVIKTEGFAVLAARAAPDRADPERRETGTVNSDVYDYATPDRADTYDWRICLLHGKAQDDPTHDYTYPDCENAGYAESVATPDRADPDSR